MPLGESYPKAVAFVIGEDRKGNRCAIGTAFLVRYPVPVDEAPNACCYYLATAAHVVRGQRTIAVRFRTRTGDVRDFPAPQWIEHATDDVAAAGVRMDFGVYDHASIPIEAFVDASDYEVQLGEDVFFLGLLSGIPEMEQQNVPMVRGGCIGAMFQPSVPIRLTPELTVRITAHLIDCRSYQGFSGSPCFVQLMRGNPSPNVIIQQFTYLLGVVSAHFDKKEPVLDVDYDPLEEYRPGATVPIHTGVGVVTPVERLRELLEYEEFAEQRAQAKEAFLQARGRVGDAMSTDDPPSDPPSEPPWSPAR